MNVSPQFRSVDTGVASLIRSTTCIVQLERYIHADAPCVIDGIPALNVLRNNVQRSSLKGVTWKVLLCSAQREVVQVPAGSRRKLCNPAMRQTESK